MTAAALTSALHVRPEHFIVQHLRKWLQNTCVCVYSWYDLLVSNPHVDRDYIYLVISQCKERHITCWNGYIVTKCVWLVFSPGVLQWIVQNGITEKNLCCALCWLNETNVVDSMFYCLFFFLKGLLVTWWWLVAEHSLFPHVI